MKCYNYRHLRQWLYIKKGALQDILGTTALKEIIILIINRPEITTEHTGV